MTTSEHEVSPVAAPLAFGWQLLRGFSIGMVPLAILIIERKFEYVALWLFSWVPIAVFAMSWQRSTIGYAVGLWLSFHIYFAYVTGYLDRSQRDRDSWRSDLGATEIRDTGALSAVEHHPVVHERDEVRVRELARDEASCERRAVLDDDLGGAPACEARAPRRCICWRRRG